MKWRVAAFLGSSSCGEFPGRNILQGTEIDLDFNSLRTSLY